MTGPAHGFHHGARWREWARRGASSGPRFFVRWAPALIGFLFALLLPEVRAMILRNLRRVHGQRDGWREMRDVFGTFSQFAACLTESLGATRAEARKRHVVVRGAQQVRALLEAKKGFVIATAHLGPWDGAAQALAHYEGTPVMVVMAREDDEEAEQLHDAVRGAALLTVLRIGRHPLDALPALQHLDAGGIVAVQLDRVPSGRPAVLADLFGQSFGVPTGPFLLAGLARVPLVPIFAARTGFFARRIDIGRPLYPSRRPKPAELAALAQDAVSQMERQIAAFPRQWFHFITDDEEASGLGRASVNGN